MVGNFTRDVVVDMDINMTQEKIDKALIDLANKCEELYEENQKLKKENDMLNLWAQHLVSVNSLERNRYKQLEKSAYEMVRGIMEEED